MINIPYDFVGTFEFESLDEIIERIKKFDYKTIGKDESGSYDMYLIELGTQGKPVLFLTASVHPTEWQGTQYSLKFMEDLRDNTFPDRDLRNELLDNFQIVYIPIVNPWGFDRITDIYEPDYTARYNVNGVELNNDFYELSQQESKNVAEQIGLYEPFAFVDIHMFQPNYSVAYGRNAILANGQRATDGVRDIWRESFESYISEEITVWTNTLGPTSGLLRAYAARQRNAHTPYTLSYITEIVKPQRVDGELIRKLTNEEIYNWGTASLYLFFRTSMDYFRQNMEAPSEPSEPSPKSDFHGLVVKDQDNRELGVLENAYSVSVKRTVNEVWTASFSLPLNDPKNDLCNHFNYIDITSPSGRYMGLYRIMPAEIRKSASNDSITYECEHVLSMLMDDVIEDRLEFDQYNTRYVLQSILNLQEEKRWELGEVEFERFFHYSFENENGLLAPILSIPEAFNEQYEFTFDTTIYPWKLNLIKPSNKVKSEIRWGKDMIDFSEVSDPSEIVNYIIPKGSGEGVNQLTIEDVNNGDRFLKDDDSIADWGMKKHIWIDKRFDDAESLKENGQANLNKWKDPKISLDVNTVDLSVLEEESGDTYFVQHDQTIEVEQSVEPLVRPLNGVIRIIVEDKEYEARIISEDIADLSDEHDVSYEINNKLDDIATTQADMERKQQVNEAYSQGATNLDSYSYNDNCDPDYPAIVEFPFPDDMVNINQSILKIRTSAFRGYTRGSEAGGYYQQGSSIKSESTKSGGGGTSGPSSRQTSSAGGNHRHVMLTYDGDVSDGAGAQKRLYSTYGVQSGLYLEVGQAGDLMTAGASGNHSHDMDHTHTTPDHSHEFEVEIPGIEIPAHAHPQIYGIWESGDKPNNLIIKVDGEEVNFPGTEGEIDITNFLKKDNSGKVTREWHTVEATPDTLARIAMIVTNRFFIRSHIGGRY